MKKFSLLLFSIIFSIAFAYGQDDKTHVPSKRLKTLMDSRSKVRGFGSLDFQISEVKDNFALLAGAHGGIILNDHFTIGLGGYGIVSDLDNDVATGDERFLYGGYGGLILGVTLAPKEVLHISFPVLIGAGGAEVNDDSFWDDFNDPRTGFYENSAFFVIEPGAEVEINIASFFRLGLGVSYRHVQELNLTTISEDDLSGLNGKVSLKFGGFR